MKPKLWVVVGLCLTKLLVSAVESEGQHVHSVIEMTHYQTWLNTELLEQWLMVKEESKVDRPPLSAGRIGVEVLAGILGEYGGVMLAVLINKATHDCQDCLDHSLTTAVVGGVGWAAGSCLGVYWTGSRSNQAGSVLATFSGAVGGTVLALVNLALVGEDSAVRWLSLFAAPIGATIGFNLTRRYKSPPGTATALIDIRDGQMRLVVPTIRVQPDCYNRGTFTQNVDLVKVRF